MKNAQNDLKHQKHVKILKKTMTMVLQGSVKFCQTQVCSSHSILDFSRGEGYCIIQLAVGRVINPPLYAATQNSEKFLGNAQVLPL